MTVLIDLFIINTNAQTAETGNSHSFTVASGSYLLSDGHLSLLFARINSRGLAWSYTKSDAYHKKSITAEFEYGTRDYSTNQVRVNGFLLEYKNAFSVIKNKNSSFNNYTGYSIKTNSQFIRSGDQYSWAGITSLSLYNSLNYTWRGNTVSFDLSIPLIGFVTRPETDKTYKGFLNDMLYNSLNHPVFTSLDNHKELNLSFQYYRTISNRLSFLARASYFNKEILVNKIKFSEQGNRFQAGLSFSLKENK